MLGDLILRHCVACRRSVNPVDWTAVIALSRQLGLDGSNRRIVHWRGAVYTLIIIVRFYVCVIAGIVIVGVIVVGVVRIIVPRKKPGIESEPEAVVENEEAIVIKVCTPPVPVLVPTCCVVT